MKKYEINSLSILALNKLLIEIITSPSDFITQSYLIKSLKSQGALANLEDLDRGIASTSLNTQKNIANITLDDGYKRLDLLRNNALIAIENALESQKVINIKPGINNLKQQINELKNNKELLEIQNLMLITLIDNLIHSLAHSSKLTSKQLESYIKYIRKEIRAKTGFINHASLTKVWDDNNG